MGRVDPDRSLFETIQMATGYEAYVEMKSEVFNTRPAHENVCNSTVISFGEIDLFLCRWVDHQTNNTSKVQ